MALRDILASEGLSLPKEKNALERLAGWTAGVFDEKDFKYILKDPLLTACSDALKSVNLMLQENAKYLKAYQMAGMEYREETQAALESQVILRKYGGAIEDLQEILRKTKGP